MNNGSKLWMGLGLLVAYILVQLGGYIHIHNGDVGAAWDPFMGMVLAAMLLGGLEFLPVLFLGELSVNGLGGQMAPQLLAEAAIATVCWGAAAAFLRRHMDVRLTSQYDLFVLIFVAGLAALVEAIGHLAVDYGSNLSVSVLFSPELARSWIGDMIGVMVVTPVMMVHQRPLKWPSPMVMVEIGLQALVTLVIIALNFGRMSSGGLQLFYLMFLPGIWVSARFGLGGAVTINLVIQSAMAISFAIVVTNPEAITAYQFRMLSLTLSALFLGAAVSQRRQAEEALRIRQDQMARTSRMSTAGEMAAALAHELNQPLAATINFTRAAQRLLALPGADAQKVRIAMDGAAAQAERAGMIIRTLREFIGQGELNLRPHSVGVLFNDVIGLINPECQAADIRIDVSVDRRVTMISVDAVQIQQVLVNLIRNAVDAIVAGNCSKRIISLSAVQTSHNEVLVEVNDSGPGMPPELAGRLYQPFTTTKVSGMGLGLSISRTIIDGHGGRLWLAKNSPKGCLFRFVLPTADEQHAEGRG